MKVRNEELLHEIACLRRGIRAGYKDFKISLWFAEYLVDLIEEKFLVTPEACK